MLGNQKNYEPNEVVVIIYVPCTYQKLKPQNHMQLTILVNIRS